MSVALGLLLGLGCGGGEPDCWERHLGSGTGSGSAIEASLALPAYETVSEADVYLDWSGLSQDLWCAPLDPAEDIAAVGLIRWPELDEEEIAQAWAFDQVQQRDLDLYAECAATSGTSCWLSEFNFLGTPLDVAAEYGEDQGRYLLLFLSGAIGETRWSTAHALALLRPRASSTVDAVAFTPTCPVAELAVDLAAAGEVSDLEPLDCAPGEHSFVLDWSAVDTTVTGEPLDPARVDQLVLSRYDLDRAELEADFARRDVLATARYTLAVDGETRADLADAVDEGGTAFDGFDTALWVVELRPAASNLGLPLFVAVLSGG